MVGRSGRRVGANLRRRASSYSLKLSSCEVGGGDFRRDDSAVGEGGRGVVDAMLSILFSSARSAAEAEAAEKAAAIAAEEADAAYAEVRQPL
eukprot:COSAG05_NODE_11123_length_529_cov_1.427907_1_plen_91_part_10